MIDTLPHFLLGVLLGGGSRSYRVVFPFSLFSSICCLAARGAEREATALSLEGQKE